VAAFGKESGKKGRTCYQTAVASHWTIDERRQKESEKPQSTKEGKDATEENGETYTKAAGVARTIGREVRRCPKAFWYLHSFQYAACA
jgi:hypothetical protein